MIHIKIIMNSLFIIYGFILKGIIAGNILTFRKGEHSVSLKCPQREISIKGAPYQQLSCGSSFCENRLFTKIKRQCDSNFQCAIYSHHLNSCSKELSYVDIFFACCLHGKHLYRIGRIFSNTREPVNIKCDVHATIEIGALSFIYETIKEDQKCFNDSLKDFCDMRPICNKERRLQEYIREKKYKEISYTCTDKTGLSTATKIKTTNMQLSTNHDIHVPDTNTAGKTGSPSATNSQPTVMQLSPTHDRPDKGKTDSSTMSTATNNQTTAMESSTTHDIPDTDIAGKTDSSTMSTATNNQTTAMESSTTHDIPDTDIAGTIAGTLIGGILVVVVVVAIVAVCIRCKRFSNDLHKKRAIKTDQTSQCDVFTDSQDTGMYNANQRAPDTFVYSVANDTCRGVTAEENGGEGYYVLEIENRFTNARSDTKVYEYAIPLNEAFDNSQVMTQKLSGEKDYSQSVGEYVQTTSPKHRSSGEAIYSHSVDGVYDTAASTTHDKNSDNLYSHSVDGIYDKTSDREQNIKNDNMYSHSVDGVYDKARQNVATQDAEDTYNHMFGAATNDDYDIPK